MYFYTKKTKKIRKSLDKAGKSDYNCNIKNQAEVNTMMYNANRFYYFYHHCGLSAFAEIG